MESAPALLRSDIAEQDLLRPHAQPEPSSSFLFLSFFVLYIKQDLFSIILIIEYYSIQDSLNKNRFNRIIDSTLLFYTGTCGIFKSAQNFIYR